MKPIQVFRTKETDRNSALQSGFNPLARRNRSFQCRTVKAICKRILVSATVGAIALGLSTVSHAQDGILADPGISAASFEQELGHYLNGNEIKSVLTPGEFSQFPLKLKAGQVVIGEARSDDFDPALEIVDANNKTLAFNDDRYPGDQRPLLFWRCEEDGDYQLHVRCFHDKTGGQFFVRFNIYKSVDLSSGQKVEAEIDAHELAGRDRIITEGDFHYFRSKKAPHSAA